MKKTLLLSLILLPLLASCLEKQVYIVYLGEHSGEKTYDEIEEHHHSYLFSLKESVDDAKASLLYSYKNSINGFAAVLSPEEASKLSAMEEVVSVFPSHPKKYSLHTTRSWEFIGLDEEPELHHNSHYRDDLLLKAKYGKDVVVGLLDSGVWPESKSFSDENMGPIPKSWKGICQSGDDFNSSHCNKKLIGARYYLKGYEQYYGPLNRTLDSKSPRDKDGHGTHTSSTVGGRKVPNSSAYGGFARGTASGGAPLVHLAMYKVCWAIPRKGKEDGNTCFDEDMLAAIDDAIADGVNVLSISIGSHEIIPYSEDSIAIGALHAVKKNIVVACSAGNNGPTPSTLSNQAPWIITVGASSLDRKFFGTVLLGNGMKIEGQTLTTYKLEKKMYPLVYAAQVAADDVPKTYIAGQCLPGSLAPEKTKGKIVLCLRGNGTRIGKGEEVKRAGGVGYILGNSPAQGSEVEVDAHVLPATALNSDDATKILKYINSTKNPTAYIGPARTVLHTQPAPSMTVFSSRGPNSLTPDLLKPDITAPGQLILAAWSGASSPTKMDSDPRRVAYNLISGTSMSCPHVGAAAALVKAVHPTWSSAAVRSALMTTASQRNNMGGPITDHSGLVANPFQYGSGHLNPSNAADPGLVYDATYTDYLLFLCSNGVTNIDSKFNCPTNPPTSNNLNYPSISISNLNGTVTLERTVTNVGGGKSVYFSRVGSPSGTTVKVLPPIMHFSRVGEKKSFKVIVRENGLKKDQGQKGYRFGWIAWGDGVHIVHSPMAVSST